MQGARCPSCILRGTPACDAASLGPWCLSTVLNVPCRGQACYTDAFIDGKLLVQLYKREVIVGGRSMAVPEGRLVAWTVRLLQTHMLSITAKGNHRPSQHATPSSLGCLCTRTTPRSAEVPSRNLDSELCFQAPAMTRTNLRSHWEKEPTQCAAVKTHLRSIKVPPQKWLDLVVFFLRKSCRLTCHLQVHWAALLPCMMRVPSFLACPRMPH